MRARLVQCCRAPPTSARACPRKYPGGPVRPEKAKPSVCWYAPLQLLRTARLVAVATVFGRHADPRLIEGITRDNGSEPGPHGKPPFGPDDYCRQETPFWIDYVSDTGDGWDATYTV